MILKAAKRKIVPALSFLLFGLTLGGSAAETQPKRDILVRAEFGLSQDGKVYARPRLRYFLPVSRILLFAETTYEHRFNEMLEGNIDYWLRAGLLGPLVDGFEAELSLNHLCRHFLSLPGTYVLSVNEAIGRLWWRAGTAELGLGAGTYFNSSRVIFAEPEGRHGLAVANLNWTRIQGTPFSVSLECKWVDFKKPLPDLELRAEVGAGAFLFVRNVTTYGLPNLTHFGLGFDSGPVEGTNVAFVSTMAQVLPSDPAHKLVLKQEVDLDLYQTPTDRVFLGVEADLPVLRGQRFLGLFRPERLDYPFRFGYERRLGDSTFVFGYGQYRVSLPIDRPQKFQTTLGAGLGLRNQRVFEVLEHPLRYEVSGGLSAPHDYDLLASLGANTVGRRPDFGLEAFAQLNSRAQQAGLMALVEFGGPTRIRLFAGVDWLRDLVPDVNDTRRYWVGFGLLRYDLSEI